MPSLKRLHHKYNVDYLINYGWPYWCNSRANEDGIPIKIWSHDAFNEFVVRFLPSFWLVFFFVVSIF